MASTDQQSLWVFPSKEVVFACAQVFKWLKSSDTRLTIRVFPVRINIGKGLEHSLGIEDRILEMAADRPSDFEVWMHLRLREAVAGVHTLKFELPASSYLPYSDQWYVFRAGEKASFFSKFSWLFIMGPAQASKDSKISQKWEQQKRLVKDISTRLGFTFKESDESLRIQIDGIRQLRSWALEMLTVFQGLKEGKKLSCLMVCLERNESRPGSLDLDLPDPDWSQFKPDVLYLPLKNVFQLGPGFEPADPDPQSREKSISDLVGIRVNTKMFGEMDQRLNVFLPKSLTQGKYDPCFYCGLKSHRIEGCPSRNMFSLDPVWGQLEKTGLEEISQGLEKLDQELSSGTGVEDILQQSTLSGTILRAVFSINHPAQHRTIRLVWRSRGNDWPDGLRQLSSFEEVQVWSALENFRMRQSGFAESSAKKLCLRHPKDYQPKTLLGFIALEKGNPREAQKYFDEAIDLGYTSLQKAYHHYLKGRMKETARDYVQAQSHYQDAERIAPRMYEARYRQGVCMVKSGHIDQALGLFWNLIKNDPVFFNYILIDPELKDGHVHFMSSLYPIWKSAVREAGSAEDLFPKLEKKISDWFDADHPSQNQFNQRLDFLRQYSGIDNYVARARIVEGSRKLFDDIAKKIEEEVILLKKDQHSLVKRLREIKSEVSWFPLAGLLLARFNRVAGQAFADLKKVSETDLGTASGFRKGHELIRSAREKIGILAKKLSYLKTVRDGLLFILIMFKTFLWTIVIVLGLSLLAVPGAAYLGMRHGMGWAYSMVDQVGIVFQLGMVIVGIFSLGLAAILTVLGFEKKKARYLSYRE